MTVTELMELLEDMDANAEVRIAYQPNYPLQVSVKTVTDLTNGAEPSDSEDGICNKCSGYASQAAAERELDDDDFDDEEMCDCDRDEIRDDDKVVWIATGSATGTGYAPGEAWNGTEDAW